MKHTTPKPPLEKEIQLCICDYLALRRHFFGRMNTAPIFEKKTGFYRPLPKYTMAGFPDIWVIKDGHFIGLEVKRPTGRQSEGQIEFEKNCKQAGGQYYVVTSLDDVIKLGL